MERVERTCFGSGLGQGECWVPTTYNFPPTDLKVIAAVRRQTENIMKKLEANFVFTEANQAIYTKIVDVIFSLKDKGEDLFPTTIPRIGGFQISMCMLRTI